VKILDTTIEKGNSYQLSMDIARLHTRTKIEVPVIVERGHKPGPTLLLSAGIHGNEVNGVEIVRQIIAKGYHKPEAGTVICVPVVNVFGFLNQSRLFPDGRDLNRVFPGSAKGSLASRYAYAFMEEIIPHADYIIDYHTGGAQRFNYSQVRTVLDDTKSTEMATQFGAKFIIDAKQREKSMREAATALGKTVLLFEGGKSLDLDKVVTNVGIWGAMRVMQYLGMRDFSATLSTARVESPVFIKESNWIRAKHSGMFRTYARNGVRVKKGDILGTISDPYGGFEKKVKAKEDGYIICLNHAPIVNQGDALVHLATA
jgi:predicted deacylase